MAKPRTLLPVTMVVAALLLPACGGGGGGGGGGGSNGPHSFTLRIENLSAPLAATGVFDTPVGAASPGPATPGHSFSFSFAASPGENISFVTMYGQSNDLFFAPAPTGIALFDAGGDPVTGDVSSQVSLWDAGTEINEAPGTGASQAPRQPAPNTGPDENGLVRPISMVNDGFTYFTNIKVTLSYAGGLFTLTIANPSASTTPLAPGVWIVHSAPGPIFLSGYKDRGEGLEAAAEDGNPAALAASLALRFSYVSSVLFNTPDSGGGAGPALPGDSFTIQFAATPGDRVSFATMYGESNDLFFAPSDEGIQLFDAGGNPTTGDVSSQITLWDAGTEVNEPPGAGPNQAPRQVGPDTGTAENVAVEPVANRNDGFTYFTGLQASLSYSAGTFTLKLTNPASSPTPIAPGLLVVHRSRGPLFISGVEDRGEGLEPLAEDGNPSALAARIANLRGISSTGVFDTPTGANTPGPALPGQSFSVTFDASPGDLFSFATMYGQSNDLFFGNMPQGIPLFTPGGVPMTGDVSPFVQLWDAGTEMNEPPGTGPNQAPRQAAVDTGFLEVKPVRPIGQVNDGFTWFTGVTASLTYNPGTRQFTFTILNPPTSPTPLAPGVFAVHRYPGALFSAGARDRGEGLETLAEDGRPAGLAAVLARDASLAARNAAFGTPVAPGVWAVHGTAEPIFTEGALDRNMGLKPLAEDADPTMLAASLAANPDVSDSGTFTTPAGAGGPGPAQPGQAFEVTFTANPGDRLSFATMFGQSNDLFFSPTAGGLALFDAGGKPVTGDVTGKVFLWDAGTEVNQMPGAGSYQAPRQPQTNYGTPEGLAVRRLADVSDGFVHPTVSRIIRVTLK